MPQSRSQANRATGRSRASPVLGHARPIDKLDWTEPNRSAQSGLSMIHDPFTVLYIVWHIALCRIHAAYHAVYCVIYRIVIRGN